MQQENIRYVLVWSVWLRLSHWIIAGGVLFQITSAWALEHDEANAAYWLDWHLIAGQIILMALALRVVLLFFPGSNFPGSRSSGQQSGDFADKQSISVDSIKKQAGE